MNNEQKNVPKLRFPEYHETWKEYQLDDLYRERNERGNDSLPILSVSIHYGVSDDELDTENLGKNVRRSEDKSTYKHVYPGDLIFNMMRAWQGAIGVAKSEGMISPAYISAIPNDKVFPLFMDYRLRRDDIIGQINNLSYGVTDFRKRLYWNSFVKVSCRLPSANEQKDIVELMQKYDTFITLKQRKLEQIKEYKKGMLQKMFPKEGESVPEVRFPGFTGEWEQRKLGGLVSFSKGSGYSKGDLKMKGTPIILYGRLYTKYEIVISDVDTFVDEKKGSVYSNGGEVIVPASGETAEDISIASVVKKSGILLGGDLNIITPPNNLDSAFLAISISNGKPHNDMAKMAQGKSVVHLHNSDLAKIDLSYPSYNEQCRISGFFSDIDTLINLHQRKLDAMKEYKKGLLQQMFV